MNIKYILYLFVVFVFSGCLTVENAYEGLAPGMWRGVLQIEPSYVSPNPKGKPLPEKVDLTYEEVTQGELPFLFQVTYTDEDSFNIEFILGDRSVTPSRYTIGKDYSTAKDTLTLFFESEHSFLKGVFEEKILEGIWFFRDPAGVDRQIPVIARQGQDFLFTTLKKQPAAMLTGSWNIQMGIEGADYTGASLELRQNLNDLEGVLNMNGKRFMKLTGTVQANKLYLAFFDGSDALLLEGKILEDGTLSGLIRIGNYQKSLWQAIKSN
jgi:hypothetical protein